MSKEYRPANMSEWQQISPLMDRNSIEAVLPENPHNVFQVEKALKQLKFRKVMCNKYKMWFSDHTEYVSALHSIEDEFRRGLQLIVHVADAANKKSQRKQYARRRNEKFQSQ